MLELIREIGWNISILVIVLSALILYFGKLISDTQVEKYDRLNLYITGLIFSIYYVFLPFLLVYIVYEKMTMPLWLIYPVELFVVSLLSIYLFVSEYFYRFGWTHVFKKSLEKGVKDIRGEKTRKGNLVDKYEKIYKDRAGHGYAELYLQTFKGFRKIFNNKYALFIASFIIILTTIYSLEVDDIIWSGLVILTSFVGLTMLAIAYGFRKAYYPPALVVLKDGEKLEGRILKFGDYLYLMNDEKEEKIFVNNDNIKYIIESKYKYKKVKK